MGKKEQRRRQLRLLLNCPTGRLPSPLEIKRQGGPPKLVERRLKARRELRKMAPTLPPMARSPRRAEPPKGRWLYRMWSASDTLLYVGITDRGKVREREHSRTKSWWPEVHHITYERVATRAELEHREREAIRRGHPRYNIQHNR